MPVVETVAMQGIKSAISPRLLQALEETIAAGEQAIIFLNRRGYARYWSVATAISR
jgi:primosomal protein N' (replication factor Y)